MRYFKDTEDKVYAYDETLSFFDPLIEKAIAAHWEEITGHWPPTETQEQAKERLTPALGSAINDGAMQWGYDSIISAVSYAISANPQYVKEAQALGKWRDEVWAWGIPALDVVTPGETAGQFLSDMPELPPKP